jgi:endonuclease/exonuclease/phosphatase family metal-dependent hydrolase
MNQSPAISIAVPGSQALAPRRHAKSYARWWQSAPRNPRAWVAVVILAVAVWGSSLRIPAGPAAGVAFEGSTSATAPARATFRVGIFNIHGGRGRDRRRDLSRTADQLRGLDIVGLNEVLGPKLWWQTDQCRQLGEAIGTGWLFVPTESRWWDGSFGNGMLCALPVTSWQRIPLPRDGSHTYRNMVLSNVEAGGRHMHVLVTHLDSRDNARRQEQLRTVGQLFLSLAPPAILMGDMNTPPDDPRLVELLGTPGVLDALAQSTTALPPQRIDWILTRGLRTVASGCDDQGASDHPHYWAELEVAD